MATDKLLKLSQVGIIKQDSDDSYDAKGAAAAVLGEAADESSANTVYGAKKKAAEVQSAVVGDASDASSAATVNGAKKKAEEEAAAVLGTASDTASDNTVYGAKAAAAGVQSAIVGDAETDTADSLTLNGLKKAVAAASANIPDDVVTEDELDAKGYQTAANVAAAIEGYGYQTASDVEGAINSAIATAMDYKGVKATKAELPASGNKTGDVWHVTADSSEYAWNGSEWEELGVTFDASGYVTADDIVYATDDEVRAALGQTAGN